VTDPSDAPPSAGTVSPGVVSPAGESALDALAADLNRQFAGAADAGVPLQDLPLPARRLPEGQIVGVLFPPEATPDYLICSLGPCIHYSTQVVHLETKNQEVSGDGIAHAERTHWCDHFKRDLDDRVFDCSRWEPASALCDGATVRVPGEIVFVCNDCGLESPAPRGSHERDGAALRRKHLASICIKPEAVTGYSVCKVCEKLRERSGVCDWEARGEFACAEAIRLEMAESPAKTTIGIARKMRANMRVPPSAFCACGENPDRIPKER